MGYEIFSGRYARTPNLEVSITSGTIRLNSNAMRLLQKSEVEFVRILWDKELRKVGLQRCAGTQGSFTVIHAKSHARIACAQFIEHIKCPHRLKISATWDPDRSMLEFAI